MGVPERSVNGLAVDADLPRDYPDRHVGPIQAHCVLNRRKFDAGSFLVGRMESGSEPQLRVARLLCRAIAIP